VELAGLRADTAFAMKQFVMSERRACRLVELDRSSYRYEPRADHNAELREELVKLARQKPRYARKQLKEVGWAKGIEIAKLARRDRQHFDCATWLHKARVMPKEEFKQEVEKELTGRETEPWEIIYFKLYQSQMPVIERAIERQL
jgi:hypothetical protein